MPLVYDVLVVLDGTADATVEVPVYGGTGERKG